MRKFKEKKEISWSDLFKAMIFVGIFIFTAYILTTCFVVFFAESFYSIL
tara:strand:- start:834 stop:980 length:147 start_codon:yes stop_codon:yes gene_type:complete